MMKPIKTFICKICKFRYPEKKWADACQAWCSKNKSCNTAIIKYAIKSKRRSPFGCSRNDPILKAGVLVKFLDMRKEAKTTIFKSPENKLSPCKNSSQSQKKNTKN